MQVDVLVRNGKLLLPSDIVNADVAINDGKIAQITRNSSGIKADRIIDAKGMYVLPGVIDPHVHFGIYSGSFDNDVETETGAMAIGGVTTAIHFLQENGSYLEPIRKAKAIVQKRAIVDVAFQVILMNQGHLKEIPRYAKLGISAGKLYMNGSEYKILGMETDIDDAYLYQAFSISKQLGFLPKLHCENFYLAKAIGEKVKRTGKQGLSAWNAFRPAVCEEEAMQRAMLISKYTGTRIYIVHNTTAAAELLSERAFLNNQEVWFETCPHYLTFTEDDDIGILGKVNPPIRTAADRESLWSGIKRGLIHTIGSDHAPNLLKLKKGKGDIWSALLGFGGSPFIFPTLFTEGVNKRGLNLCIVPRITSYNTARVHGIVGKGLLAPGYDADLAIIDAKNYRKVSAKDLGTYADYSLFDDRKMTGWPAYTLSRGRIVAENFQVVKDGSKGKFVPCKTTADR